MLSYKIWKILNSIFLNYCSKFIYIQSLAGTYPTPPSWCIRLFLTGDSTLRTPPLCFLCSPLTMDSISQGIFGIPLALLTDIPQYAPLRTMLNVHLQLHLEIIRFRLIQLLMQVILNVQLHQNKHSFTMFLEHINSSLFQLFQKPPQQYHPFIKVLSNNSSSPII